MIEGTTQLEHRARVFIVDDHPIVRSGLASVIESCERFSLVGSASSPMAARRELKAADPDVVVLDVLFNDDSVSGIDLAAWIRSELPETKIVVFTSYGTEGYIRKMLQHRVEGYVTKDEAITQVEMAIDAVTSGHIFYSSALLPRLANAIEAAAISNTESHINAQEADVLQFVAAGLTNEEIARKMNLSTSRVRDVIGNSSAKLGANNRTQAAILAAKLGYIDV